MIWWILLTLWVAGMPYYAIRLALNAKKHDLWKFGWGRVLYAVLTVLTIAGYPLALWWALLSRANVEWE